MPGGAGTRIERDHCATNSCRLGRLEKRINAYVPVKYSADPLLEFCEPDLFISMFFLSNYQPSTLNCLAGHSSHDSFH